MSKGIPQASSEDSTLTGGSLLLKLCTILPGLCQLYSSFSPELQSYRCRMALSSSSWWRAGRWGKDISCSGVRIQLTQCEYGRFPGSKNLIARSAGILLIKTGSLNPFQTQEELLKIEAAVQSSFQRITLLSQPQARGKLILSANSGSRST